MKKWILLILIVGSGAWADIEVKMNTKALYNDLFEKLTEEQKNYINENMDIIKDQTNNVLREESKNISKKKFINERIAVEFNLNTDGTMNNFNYLSKSDARTYNDLSKKVCEIAIKKYPIPKEETPIRLIFAYIIGKDVNREIGTKEQEKINENIIQRGSTRFEHSMKEQVREFITSKDGFINVNLNPSMCASLTLLTESNKIIGNGTYYSFLVNKEVAKGKYKLLVQTKETCNVNIQYP
ncbi:MAG: hypothetical protein PHV62_06830 [Sulfuricurvum sp.]|nr:hypothetical protein [Sulfuricurvum sp.]